MDVVWLRGGRGVADARGWMIEKVQLVSTSASPPVAYRIVDLVSRNATASGSSPVTVG
ncbi:hypothetical protein RB11671 [Rhodopirellula baltica SH 1]|uniref:Uncharacterized protein n=2 Tax=Rhodopirellula baltica TaxID=265606 RepID=Q7UE03_RHOBA|nr:hypothetical protein RB11671 [Rhodopirellula baltica SH 1]